MLTPRISAPLELRCPYRGCPFCQHCFSNGQNGSTYLLSPLFHGYAVRFLYLLSAGDKKAKQVAAGQHDKS